MNAFERVAHPGAAHATTRDSYVIRLRDGASVCLRPAHDDDDAFRILFYTLSETSRYLYFGAGIPANESWASRFTTLGQTDSTRSFVLVAEVEGNLVGFARFSQGPDAAPDSRAADVGIMLTDAWQCRGLGGPMLTQLAHEALRRGVTTFTAEALWENRRLLRMAHRVFPEMRIAYESGSCSLTIDLESWQVSQSE